MDVQEFEKYWPERNTLAPELQTEIETKRNSCPDCKAYSAGGDQIRDVLRSLHEVNAPDNFAYKMRVYAANHKDETVPLLERPIFKWTSMSVGLAAGAMALFVFMGPFSLTSDSPAGQASMGAISDTQAESNAPVENVKPIELASTESESLKTTAQDSSADIEEMTREYTPPPNINIRTVSTTP